MSIQRLSVYTELFADPSSSDAGAESQTADENISFRYATTTNLTTLSSNVRSPRISGLLFVPDLPAVNSCGNATIPFIPNNVTRVANLPSSQYYAVGLAPWINTDCALGFLNAVRTTRQPLIAMLFYMPDNSTSQPPQANDPMWSLNDGRAWQNSITFPVYALPGAVGSLLMAQSALYSGNISTVPNGNTLATNYPRLPFARLAATINTDLSNGGLPNLWVFLLIVLGVLLTVIGLTSLVMHFIQRRRKAILRRRVVNGEVDLAVLGIKHLTVPQDVLDKMPLFTYGTDGLANKAGATSATWSNTRAEHGKRLSRKIKPDIVADRTSKYRPDPLAQSVCAICLDDFVAAGTDSESEEEASTVRELPCRHIFHPECVDTFLRENSSLCPICKTSVLPKGYCPAVITNVMIRRERAARRAQSRNATNGMETSSTNAVAPEVVSPPQSHSPTSRYLTFWRHSRRDDTSRNNNASPEVELGPVTTATATSPRETSIPPPTDPSTIIPPSTPPLSAPGRREWARQRAVAMLGGRLAQDEAGASGESQRPAWRRALQKVFPVAR